MRLFVLTGDNPLRDSKWVKRIWLLPKVAITCLYVIKGDKMCLFALHMTIKFLYVQMCALCACLH